VNPPVLGRVFANKGLEGAGVFLRQPAKGVFLVFPLLGQNNAAAFHLEKKTVSDAPRPADHNRQIVMNRQQRNTFVGAGLASEEIYENPFAAGILIGNKADGCPLPHHLLHLFGSAEFIDNLLSMPLANAVEIAVDVGIIEGPGNAVHIKAPLAEHIADNFKIAVVARCHQQALLFLHHPFDPFDVYKAGILAPLLLFHQTRGKKYIHHKHHQMLKGTPAHLFMPSGIFFGISGPQILEGPGASAGVMPPHLPAEKTGQPKVPFYRKQPQNKKQSSQGCIAQPVQKGIPRLFFLFRPLKRHCLLSV